MTLPQPTELPYKNKMYAFFVTTWIGNGQDFRQMWWCPSCGWRREWTEQETQEQQLRQTYEYFVSVLEIGEETDGTPLTEEHRMAITHVIEDALERLPSIAEPFIYPKCEVCRTDTKDWQTTMGNGLISHVDYPDEGPQRPNIPDGIVTYIEDVTGQYVHLLKGIPNPNLIVVKVGELRKKHQGGLSNLSVHLSGVMLERQWKPDGPMTGQITDGGLESWLKAKGIPELYAKQVSGENRTQKMIELAEACGKPVFDSEAIT